MTEQPEHAMYWQWSRLHLSMLIGNVWDGQESPAKLRISDRRTIRIYVVNNACQDYDTPVYSHMQMQYDTSRWKLRLMLRLHMHNPPITLNSFVGDLGEFNRDTLTAKLLGAFEQHI